jgi:hypothetical protein
MISPSNHRHPNRYSIIRYLTRPILFHKYSPNRIPRPSRPHLGPGSIDQAPSIPPHYLDPSTMGFSTYLDPIIYGNVCLSTLTRHFIKPHLPHGFFPRYHRILPFVRTWSRTCYLGRTFRSTSFRGEDSRK